MHDPKTVAFEIKNLFLRRKGGYYEPLITIWHCDPENFRFKDGTQKQGGGRDDSCGWHSPMYNLDQLGAMKVLAKNQYRDIFARQVAEKEGKDYAYVCNQPDSTYEVIYWVWRAIKAHGKKGWMYGRTTNFLSSGELEQIMILATNPVDNFRWRKIINEESFVEMFLATWHCYRRYHRPWYKHPRWHIHHWQIQFHPFQQIYRRYWQKCSVCGKRGFKGSACGDWSGTKIWHSECDTARVKQATN